MSFSQKISQFSFDAIELTEEVRMAVEEEVFRSVIKDTPVDEGRLRGNWQATKNSPATGTLDSIDKNGAQTIDKAVQLVRSSEPDQTLYLTNNLPYAVRIEYGYSDKAPEGMVRRNLSRITELIRQKARES